MDLRGVCRTLWRQRLRDGLSGCLGLAGQAAKSYRIGEGCVDLHRDIGAVWNQDASARGSLWKILSQWKRAHYHSFRLDDPRPGLYAARGVLLERLRRPK
jgi:D-aspartate ligase